MVVWQQMATLKPQKTTLRSKTIWRVNVPRSLSGGKRRRRFFQLKEDADAYAEELKASMLNASSLFFRLNESDQAAVLRSLQRLGSDAKKLEEAVDLYLKSNASTGQKISVPDLIKECLRSKEASNKSIRYLQSLKSSLGRFAIGDRAGKMAHEITPQEIEGYLASENFAVATRRSKLRDFRTLFAFAEMRGYVARNPAMAVELPEPENKAPGILRPAEAGRLMRAAEEHDQGLIPFLAKGLFGGLRPDEAQRSAAADRHGEQLKVHVTKVRSQRNRMIHLNPTLCAWLDRYTVFDATPITNLTKRLRRLRAAAQVPWPHDCLRHSFASYHLALHKDANRTAHEMGHHNSTTLYAHYRALVTEVDAKLFWVILPTEKQTSPNPSQDSG